MRIGLSSIPALNNNSPQPALRVGLFFKKHLPHNPPCGLDYLLYQHLTITPHNPLQRVGLFYKKHLPHNPPCGLDYLLYQHLTITPHNPPCGLDYSTKTPSPQPALRIGLFFKKHLPHNPPQRVGLFYKKTPSPQPASAGWIILQKISPILQLFYHISIPSILPRSL